MVRIVVGAVLVLEVVVVVVVLVPVVLVVGETGTCCVQKGKDRKPGRYNKEGRGRSTLVRNKEGPLTMSLPVGGDDDDDDDDCEVGNDEDAVRPCQSVVVANLLHSGRSDTSFCLVDIRTVVLLAAIVLMVLIGEQHDFFGVLVQQGVVVVVNFSILFIVVL